MRTNLTSLKKRSLLLMFLSLFMCIALAACSPGESIEEEEEDGFTPAISLDDAMVVVQIAFDYGEPGRHQVKLVDPEYIGNETPYYQFKLVVDEEDLESYVLINQLNGRLYSMDAEGTILPLNQDPYFIPYLTGDVDFGIDTGDRDEDTNSGEDAPEVSPTDDGNLDGYDDAGQSGDAEDVSTDPQAGDEPEPQDGE